VEVEALAVEAEALEVEALEGEVEGPQQVEEGDLHQVAVVAEAHYQTPTPWRTW
jgi:hypothetical protein